MMGLTSRDSLGALFARELTSIATNSNGIALELHCNMTPAFRFIFSFIFASCLDVGLVVHRVVDQLMCLLFWLAKVWSVKQHILGPGEGMQQQVRILNRLLTWAKSGIECEADQRHADFIIKQLGSTASKPVGSSH